MLMRLHEVLSAVCPVVGCSGTGPTARIDYTENATPQQIAAAQSALASFDWSQAAHDAWLLSKYRSSAVAGILADKTFAAMVVRALALVTMDEINLIRATLAQLKTGTAGAGTFAAFKGVVAGLNSNTPRTKTMVRNAIDAKINAGDADS
jgi:hypothetical protein